MVHIASEIVVLLGLTFYFNQKNKKILGHIEDLAQRVEEQDDLLQKHEQVIRNLVDHINKLELSLSNKKRYPIQKKVTPKTRLITRSKTPLDTRSKMPPDTRSKMPPDTRSKMPPDTRSKMPPDARSEFYETHSESQVNYSEQNKPNPDVTLLNELVEEKSESGSEDESESDLDAELTEELQELNKTNDPLEKQDPSSEKNQTQTSPGNGEEASDDVEEELDLKKQV